MIIDKEWLSIYLIGTQAQQGQWKVLPKIKCKDGFSLSVQASRMHYCYPRTDKGPWHAFELGMPSDPVESLLEYAEDPDRLTETVYACVPIQLVVDIINEHGGPVNEET